MGGVDEASERESLVVRWMGKPLVLKPTLDASWVAQVHENAELQMAKLEDGNYQAQVVTGYIVDTTEGKRSAPTGYLRSMRCDDPQGAIELLRLSLEVIGEWVVSSEGDGDADSN